MAINSHTDHFLCLLPDITGLTEILSTAVVIKTAEDRTPGKTGLTVP